MNIRAKQRASFKQVSEKKTPVREDRQAVRSVFHDARMAQPVVQRGRKQFKFNEPGTYGRSNDWSKLVHILHILQL